MEFQEVILKLAHLFLYQFLATLCYRAAIKLKNYFFFFFKNPPQKPQTHEPPLFQSLTNFDFQGRGPDTTLVCDMHGGLLRSKSLFPFFMLVAFEGGSIFRALFLLCSSPLLWVLDYDLKLKVMIFISFCGLKVKDMECVGRAVLPKFYHEDLHLQVCEVLGSVTSVGSKVVVFTSLPRVMVEGFLKEYLSVDNVVGTQLHRCGQFFTGLVSGSGLVVKHRAVKDYFGDNKPDIGLGSSTLHDHLFLSQCKESYVVNKEDNKSPNTTSCVIPREKYPKPLILHDGRLAFLPTPQATLTMFMWLPLGVLLAIFRISVGVFLPYKWTRGFVVWTGHIRLSGCTPIRSNTKKGVLYVCNHRTLLDAIMLSIVLAKPLTTVSYSVSKLSEIMAPIKIVRLARDRNKDGETIKKILREGDHLHVCPEGTTCREPYLLRFSPLFAELTDDIVPVAINTHVTMFYGTTATGFKFLDPIFFLMNPLPKYHIHILDKLPQELTCGGGRSSIEVANYIQAQLANHLGFECTNLTRRDKYLLLAGNDGVVRTQKA